MPPLPPAGPLPVRVQEGLAGLVFVFEPEGARVLGKGERRFRVRLDVGNNAFYNGKVVEEAIYEDNERQELRVGAAWGSGRGREVRADLTLAARNGGITDSFVRFWHHAVVPFTTPGQEGQPPYQSVIDVQSGAAALHLQGGAAAPTSLVLGAKTTLNSPSPRVDLAVRGALKIPLAGRSSYLDGGGVDLGVGLLATARLNGRLTAHGNLNVVRSGTTSVGVLKNGLRVNHGSVVALEWRTSQKDSLVMQAEESTFPFVRTLDSGAGGRRQMSFGVVRSYSGGSRAHVALSENIYPFRTTAYVPDVGVSFGFERRW